MNELGRFSYLRECQQKFAAYLKLDEEAEDLRPVSRNRNSADDFSLPPFWNRSRRLTVIAAKVKVINTGRNTISKMKATTESEHGPKKEIKKASSSRRVELQFLKQDSYGVKAFGRSAQKPQ